jgi:hypothetical protein
MFGREFFKFLRISTLKFKKMCEREGFELFKLTKGVKDFFESFQSFKKSGCFSICVQNVFFSNGILESHGEV